MLKNLCCLCDFLNAYKNYGIKQTLSLFIYTHNNKQRAYTLKFIIFHKKAKGEARTKNEVIHLIHEMRALAIEAHILNVNGAQNDVFFVIINAYTKSYFVLLYFMILLILFKR